MVAQARATCMLAILAWLGSGRITVLQARIQSDLLLHGAAGALGTSVLPCAGCAERHSWHCTFGLLHQAMQPPGDAARSTPTSTSSAATNDDKLAIGPSQDLAPAGPSDMPTTAGTAAARSPAAAAPAAAAADHSRQPCEPPVLQLLQLPREVLLRVMAFLAADDLTAAGGVSRAARELACEEVLWRRLYCARWGRQRSNSSTKHWKVGCSGV